MRCLALDTFSTSAAATNYFDEACRFGRGRPQRPNRISAWRGARRPVRRRRHARALTGYGPGLGQATTAMSNSALRSGDRHRPARVTGLHLQRRVDGHRAPGVTTLRQRRGHGVGLRQRPGGAGSNVLAERCLRPRHSSLDHRRRFQWRNAQRSSLRMGPGRQPPPRPRRTRLARETPNTTRPTAMTVCVASLPRP